MNIDNTKSLIYAKNQEYIKHFQKNDLMILIRSQAMHTAKNRSVLLDAIQVFSDYFQKSVQLRSALCEDDKFSSLVHEHLVEEFDHNEELRKDRNNRPTPWDPILDATASWFNWKMFTLDNIEKHIVMHLVLEASANCFFQEAHKVMSQYNETKYFDIHAEADDKHEEMGYELLSEVNPNQVKRVLELLAHSWGIIEATCGRIAEMVLIGKDLAKTQENIRQHEVEKMKQQK